LMVHPRIGENFPAKAEKWEIRMMMMMIIMIIIIIIIIIIMPYAHLRIFKRNKHANASYLTLFQRTKHGHLYVTHEFSER
jgi:heme/copper-type cytochrome/quinol oxidase subunit 2